MTEIAIGIDVQSTHCKAFGFNYSRKSQILGEHCVLGQRGKEVHATIVSIKMISDVYLERCPNKSLTPNGSLNFIP